MRLASGRQIGERHAAGSSGGGVSDGSPSKATHMAIQRGQSTQRAIRPSASNVNASSSFLSTQPPLGEQADLGPVAIPFFSTREALPLFDLYNVPMTRRMACTLILITAAVGFGGCAAGNNELDTAAVAAETDAVGAALDGLHRAASEANGADYFALFAEDAVFIGTDIAERWSLDQFRDYAQPHFERGTGWTFVPRLDQRFVSVDRFGQVAWFDEILDSEKYGPCRGSGVLTRDAQGWRFQQYHLTIPVPNELALDLVQMIRELPSQ